MAEVLSQIQIESISINPNQPRKVFSEEELNELSSSIKQYGILQPILVKETREGKYELIAGERRLRAARMAGFVEIPAMIRHFEASDSAIVALIENLQRKDLNFFEEAEGYNKLMEEFNMTQMEIAQKIGKNQSTIANKMRLLKLEQEIKDIISSSNLTERHARALLKLNSSNDRTQVLKQIVERDMNVTDAEKLIDLKIKSKMDLPKDYKEPGASIKSASKDLRLILNEVNKIVESCQALGINVSMTKENKGSYVEIKLKVLT